MTLRDRLGNVWGCFDWGQAWFEIWYMPGDLPTAEDVRGIMRGEALDPNPDTE